MGVQTYTSLVQTIKDIIEDDSSEVSDYVPTAVFLAEEILAKDLDMSRLEVTVSLQPTVSASAYNQAYTQLYPVSTINDKDFLYFNHILQNGRKLTKVDYSYIEEFNRQEGTSSYGTSAEYWGFNATPSVIQIAPAVSGRVTNFKCNYTKRPTKLTAGETSNELIRSAPELLLYQSMVQMSSFLKHWETMATWQTQYQQSLQSHLNVSRRERKEVGQMVVTDRDQNQSTTGAR